MLRDRPFRYHFYDTEGAVTVPDWDDKVVESKTVYSLKKDLAELRELGASKGIVDAGVTSVGKSFEKRDLLAIKIGKGSDHKILFTGCHHAREWVSVEVPYLVAEYLIHNYTDSPKTPQEKRLHHLLQNREIWFVPMVNPDGHVVTEQHSRWWRANVQGYVFPANSRLRAPQFNPEAPRSPPAQFREFVIEGGPENTYVGVDINRNYPTIHWGQETYSRAPHNNENRRTSFDPRDGGHGSIWCGPRAGSEPETQAMVELLRAQRFRAGCTFHNWAQELLYPDFAEDDRFTRFVGTGMFRLILQGGAAWTYKKGSALYPVTGDMMDYTWQVTQRPSYLPELRPADDTQKHVFGFLPESEIEPSMREWVPAALALINCAGFDHPSAPLRTADKGPKTNEKRRLHVVRNCWEVFSGWQI
jgi:carboxypeptidase T